MASKRKNGEGTFDKVEKSGIMYYRWRGTLGIDPVSGRPNRRTLYAKTDKELREKVRSALSDYECGAVNAPKKMTVGQWLNQWLEECCQDIKGRTRDTYRSAIDTRIIPALGNVRLAELTPGQVQAFVNRLDGELSPKTIKNHAGVLHRALEKAVQWGYIPRNPADGCSLPRIEKREVSFLAGDDLRRFLDAIQGNRFEAVFLTAIFTGMREGELLGLCWEDVDFQRGTIHVRQQLQLVRGIYHMVATKSDKARMLTPSPFVMDVLKQVRQEQLQQRIAAGPDWIRDYDHDLVFTKPNGENIARNTLYMAFKRCLAAAGLPASIRFHDLRHSFAVFALESGDNIKEIQAALGHYSAAFTMNTYGHISENARKESAARQQAAINGLLGKSLG